MKKLGLLMAVAALLTSCAFDTDDNGVSKWLSSHGMPDSYDLQVVAIDGLKPQAASVNWNGAPRASVDSTYANFGRESNVAHDLILDFVFSVKDSFVNYTLNASDSVATVLKVYGDKKLYSSKYLPKGTLPIEEDMDVNVSWTLEFSNKEKFIKKLAEIDNYDWVDSVSSKEWVSDGSGDTTFKVSLVHPDSAMIFPLPSALAEALKELKYAAHLQLRLSAPNAKHLLRFQGFPRNEKEKNHAPTLGIYTSKNDQFKSVTTVRMFSLAANMEECEECMILHGGVRDSLVLEFPAAPIIKAVRELYGDDSYVGNGSDVRQTVVMAELTMARDDSKGFSEFGLPIQVVVGSFLDSADTVVRRMESYRLNKDRIESEGHPNLIFTDGDSLSMQITNGVKQLVNKGDLDGTLKISMKLGFPLLNANDSKYAASAVMEGNMNDSTFFTLFDYARYDFSTSVDNPMRLKLWMASKRGGEK